MRAEQLTDAVAGHGEGPAWSPRWNGVRWVDMLRGDVLELQDDGVVRRQHVGSVACLLRPRRAGGTVVVTEHHVLLSDSDDLDADLRPVARLLEDPRIRMNEGGCAPDGTLVVGSMAYDESPGHGTLWAVDAERQVSVVLEDVTISNGIAWSPGGATAYYADSPTGQIDRLAWSAERGLHDRRVFVTVGSPDGLCVDAEGGVWVARYGAGEVHRYTDGGDLSEVVEVPTPRTTAVTFAGSALDQLVITTSDVGSSGDPTAGALFTAAPGVRGLPLAEYAG